MDFVNREALWQILRIYDVGSKLLNVIKSMYSYVNQELIRVKGGEGQCFRINSGLKQV